MTRAFPGRCRPFTWRAIVFAGLMLTGPAILEAVAQGRQAPRADPLEQARLAYNEARYTDAATLAAEARRGPGGSAAATVVFARSHLEQFRLTSDRSDLVAAREALRTVEAKALSARDRVDLTIALGVALYLDDEHSLDDRFSAAAEQFELALGKPELVDAPSRDLLFDWWAGSLDRQAQLGPELDRIALYTRVLTRAEEELRQSEGAAAATYWLAAAARGVNDLPRAAGAAMSGWIRAGMLGERGEMLRQDLDRLMLYVILPERAQALATDGDARQTLTQLEEQWTQLKAKWSR